jgi:hypothetical protein
MPSAAWNVSTAGEAGVAGVVTEKILFVPLLAANRAAGLLDCGVLEASDWRIAVNAACSSSVRPLKIVMPRGVDGSAIVVRRAESALPRQCYL